MHPELVHLYGPFSINSFGLIIIIGLVVFSALFLSDPKREKIINTDQYYYLLSIAIIAGIIGGRLLFVIGDWQSMESFWDIVAVWKGGFSLLGSLLAILLVIPFYFKKMHINALAFLDLAAIYAPLLQSIARIGCFFAGCCFGIPTHRFFGIINNECPIESFINKPLHPTQLYSAGALFLIFLGMYFIFQHEFKRPGQLLCVYLILMSAERFIIDFWRGDREFLPISLLHAISVPQLVALAIIAAASAAFMHITFLQKQRS